MINNEKNVKSRRMMRFKHVRLNKYVVIVSFNAERQPFKYV